MSGLIVNTGSIATAPSTDLESVGSGPGASVFACAITSPGPGASVNQGSPVTIAGTLSAAGTVVVKLGSTTLGSATISGLNWSYSWTPQSGDVGAQTINATATATIDAATGIAPGVAITVQSSAQVIQLAGIPSAEAFGAVSVGSASPKTNSIGELAIGETFSSPSIGPSNPSSIADLALWFDGTAPAFSDSAGTTLATAPAGRVRRVDQPSPLTGSWLAPSAANRPFREANAIDIQCGTPLYMNQPAGVTLPGANFTLAMAFEHRSMTTSDRTGFPTGASGNCFPIAGNDDVGTWGWIINSGTLRLNWHNHHNSGFVDTGLRIRLGDMCAIVVRGDATGFNWTANVNGVVTSGASAQTLTGNIANLVMSYYAVPGASDIAAVSQLTGYARAISDSERDQLLTFLVANLPGEFPTSTPLIVITGDSIAQAFGSTQQASWAFTLQRDLYGLANPPRLCNTAVVAYKLSDMAADYPLFARKFYSASRTTNILIVAGATNSMRDDLGFTSADVLSQLYSICDTARADGFKVVLCTVLPRSDAASGTGFPAKRALVNADIVANWASHADALCDFAGVSGMGADSDPSNSTNYNVDLVHPTSVGQQLLEPTARAAVVSILPNTAIGITPTGIASAEAFGAMTFTVAPISTAGSGTIGESPIGVSPIG